MRKIFNRLLATLTDDFHKLGNTQRLGQIAEYFRTIRTLSKLLVTAFYHRRRRRTYKRNFFKWLLNA